MKEKFDHKEKVIAGHFAKVLEINENEKTVSCKFMGDNKIYQVEFKNLFNAQLKKAYNINNPKLNETLLVGEVVEVLQNLDNDNVKIRFISNKRFGKIIDKSFIYEIG